MKFFLNKSYEIINHRSMLSDKKVSSGHIETWGKFNRHGLHDVDNLPIL